LLGGLVIELSVDEHANHSLWLYPTLQDSRYPAGVLCPMCLEHTYPSV